METADVTPDDYLTSLEDEVRETMVTLDQLISRAMPERRRVLWQRVFWGGTDQSIIGYGDITQTRTKGEDVNWFLVGLANQKSNCSLYVNAVVDGVYLGQHYADRLGSAKIGAASIGFRRLETIDLENLSDLMSRANEVTPPDPEA